MVGIERAENVRHVCAGEIVHFIQELLVPGPAPDQRHAARENLAAVSSVLPGSARVKKPRRKIDAALKAKIALEALRERETVADLVCAMGFSRSTPIRR
jgi:hypothetical protein